MMINNLQVATLVIFFVTILAPGDTMAFPGRAVVLQQEPATSTTTTNNKVVKCPFGRRRTQNALEEMKVEAEARMEEWLAVEAAMKDISPDSQMAGEEPLVERLYVPGEQNEDEEYCDGGEDHKFCNKVHGAWGDSIPQNGTYCVWAILEFQDPSAFNYGEDNDNTTKFGGVFSATIDSVVPLLVEQKVLMVGATGGLSGGEPHALPWPTASIIWSDGNLHAKDWVINDHRQYQQAGYDFGFFLHAHYKAVQCADIMPALEKHGLFNESMAEVYWRGEGLVAGTHGFRRFWNAFSELKDYSRMFYQPEESCVLGPCPDGESEDDVASSATSAPGSGANDGGSDVADSSAALTTGIQSVGFFALVTIAILML